MISPKETSPEYSQISNECTKGGGPLIRREAALRRPAPASQPEKSLATGNTGAVLYVEHLSEKQSEEERFTPVATDYDEVRSDVKESQDRSLEALQSANAPDARSVVSELDEADSLDGSITPGGEFVAEELVVQVIPQAEDEFTCYSCFLVRHRSQIAREKNGHAYCVDCEG
jgi:hypothetical protein